MLCIFFFFSCGRRDNYKETLSVKNWAYQLENINISEIADAGFHLVVIDYSSDGSEEGEFSPSGIAFLKEKGIIPIAYISIGEAEEGRFYWNDTFHSNPPDWLGEKNPEWPDNYAVKYWDADWQDIIFQYLDKILKEGFLGIYLDKVDEFEYWSFDNPLLSEEEAALKMVDFIEKIANYCRSKAGENFYVFVQNGETILKYGKEKLIPIVSGWAVEDLFFYGTIPLNASEVEERCFYLDILKDAGKPILSVDYVDDGTGYMDENKERIDQYISEARQKGYIPYVALSDRKLDEINVIPDVQP